MPYITSIERMGIEKGYLEASQKNIATSLQIKFGAPGNALNGPKGVTYAADGSLYISDTENHVIRRIDLRQGTVSTVVGTGQRGDGPDGNPLMCKMARPHGVFIQGNTVYIGDSENHRIRALQLR